MGTPPLLLPLSSHRRIQGSRVIRVAKGHIFATLSDCHNFSVDCDESQKNGTSPVVRVTTNSLSVKKSTQDVRYLRWARN